MKNHKLISRLGNKDLDLKFFKSYLLQDIATIVEPFAGSFAVSSRFYASQKDKKYKYVLNDTDAAIYWIYINHDLYIENRIKINEYCKNYTVKNNMKKFKLDFYEFVEALKMPEILSLYFFKLHSVRGYMIKYLKGDFKPLESDIRVLKNAEFYNVDYKIIMEKYKDDSSSFLFLDPPYLYSNNLQYSSQSQDASSGSHDGSDNTDMIYEIHNYMKIAKCKVMLIINDLKIVRYIFGDFVKGQYNKLYSMSLKRQVHLVICNF